MRSSSTSITTRRCCTRCVRTSSRATRCCDVDVFLWAATLLIVLQLPLIAQVLLASSRAAAVATLQASGGIWTVTLVLLAQGFHRSAYTILAVVAAVLTFAGTMVFVRFLER